MNVIQFNYMGEKYEFETNDKVFSPQKIDIGTLSMLSYVEFTNSDKVLDLGCGYGVVGIIAAKTIGAEKVTMCDNSIEALQLAKKNIEHNKVNNINVVESNGLYNIEDKEYTKILSNPPYHTDFSVAKSFIENGYRKLAYGGRMYMVTKRKEWYKNKFIKVFGGVKIFEINGYYVFMSEKLNKNDLKYKLR